MSKDCEPRAETLRHLRDLEGLEGDLLSQLDCLRELERWPSAAPTACTLCSARLRRLFYAGELAYRPDTVRRPVVREGIFCMRCVLETAVSTRVSMYRLDTLEKVG